MDVGSQDAQVFREAASGVHFAKGDRVDHDRGRAVVAHGDTAESLAKRSHDLTPRAAPEEPEGCADSEPQGIGDVVSVDHVVLMKPRGGWNGTGGTDGHAIKSMAPHDTLRNKDRGGMTKSLEMKPAQVKVQVEPARGPVTSRRA